MDEFTKAYIKCMLWAENDNSDENTGGDPLDWNYDSSDISEESLATIISDCKKFQEQHKELLERGRSWKQPMNGLCRVA